MAETDAELKLKVWKDLALSKQMLMRAATDALKLDPNCTQDELKVALEAAIKRSLDADANVSKAQEQAKVAMAAADKKVAESKKSQDAAEAAYANALANQQKLEQQIADLRSNAAKDASDLKQRLADKERELKAINTALSDTPQNVVKKLKALQKQKMEESDARKQAEEHAATLRKEKRTLEQTIKDMQAAQDNASKLAERYRELHTLCGTLRDQLKPLVEDAKSLPAIPMLDTTLLESIEKVGAPDEKKAAGGKAKR